MATITVTVVTKPINFVVTGLHSVLYDNIGGRNLFEGPLRRTDEDPRGLDV